jgi:hypothetical protein
VLAAEVVDVELVDTLVLVEVALVLVEAALLLVEAALVLVASVVPPWLAPQTKGVGPGISYVVRVV